MTDAAQDYKEHRKQRLEWIVMLVATLLSVCLHLLILTHAGALWRDEASTAELAAMPTLNDLWKMLPHDSFPILFPLLLRGWVVSGLGASDFGLRCLGCAIGLSLLAMLWWNARKFGRSVPTVSLALLAANATLVRWGDSIRGTGTGCVLMLWCIGLTWTFVRQPTWQRFMLASLAGVLCVQCLYQNVVLLAAVCAAASLICIQCKRKRDAMLALLIGLPAALSLLPYFKPLKEAQSWWIVKKTGFLPEIAWYNLSQALASPPVVGPWLWIGLCCGACYIGLFAKRRPDSPPNDVSAHLPLFGAVSGALGAIGFFAFIYNSELPTQTWYWLPLIVFMAICLEAVLGAWLMRWQIIGLCSICLIYGFSFWAAWKPSHCRQTTIDLIATHLDQHASVEDLIVVYPWHHGVTFNRYYRGRTPWTTVPALEDCRIHRYDLLKEKLAAPQPIEPLLDQIQRVLRSGNCIWLVGQLPVPESGETEPPVLSPAPDIFFGWLDGAYIYTWGRQTESLLRTIGSQVEVVPIHSGNCVSIYEDAPLLRLKSVGSPLTTLTNIP